MEAIAQSLRGAGIVYNAYAVKNGIQTISSVLQDRDLSNGFVEKSKVQVTMLLAQISFISYATDRGISR